MGNIGYWNPIISDWICLISKLITTNVIISDSAGLRNSEPETITEWRESLMTGNTILTIGLFTKRTFLMTELHR